MYKYIIMLATILLFFVTPCLAVDQNYQLFSPDERIRIEIKMEKETLFSVYFKNEALIAPSEIALSIAGNELENIEPGKIFTQTVIDTLIPVMPAKNARVIDFYNELHIPFNEHYVIILRAYNEGVAYRFQTDFEDQITIINEKGGFNFADDYPLYFSEEKDAFYSQGERNYTFKKLSDLDTENPGFLPTLIAPQKGPKILITESDLYDYPGMWLKPTGNKSLEAVFPAHVSKIKREDSGVNSVVQRDDYIAKTQGARNYPWRIFIIAENDVDLLENEMVFCLSQPCKIKDPSWIKPGKIAWEWWNHINITGVDFKAGINTETYKYFIDFAAEYGLGYVVLDAGWYTIGDIFDLNPAVDMDALSAYAKENEVGLILRVIWRDVDDQHEKAFAQFNKWGIAGLKVDQMRRDDQDMVNYYWRVARQAAKHKILINFHGNYKPAGLHRTYPNIITREGVKGLEWVKWSEDVTPEHDVTIPFIRMVAGPMDYTPGAMINVSQKDFRIMNTKPMSMGTRAHQMAMYVIYESPQSTLADSPVHYRQDPLCTKFMAAVPEIWDETIALDGKVGEYILMVRRKNSVWYVGAMTGKNGKEFDLNFSFLGKSKYEIELFEDGINVDLNACDYKRKIKTINNKDKLRIKLAPGGGWVAKIYTPKTVVSKPSIKSFKVLSDVSYLGDGRAEKMDVYLPENKNGKKAPAILFIHGGGWTGGGKTSKRSRSIAASLVDRGYAVFCIDYKLTEYEGELWKSKIKKYSWPQNIYDCKTAVRYIRKKAEIYNVDPERIGVIGCSAGGHLALLTALSSENEELNNGGLYQNISCAVNCAVDMYGVPDVRVWGGTAFIDVDGANSSHDLNIASPVTHLSNETPPLMIIHGDKDETVDIKQSLDFVEILKKKNISYNFIIVKEGVHSFDLEPPQMDLRPVVFKFFEKYLNAKSLID